MYDWAILIVDAERAHVAPWVLAGVPETAGCPYWWEWIRATHYAVDALRAHQHRPAPQPPGPPAPNGQPPMTVSTLGR